MTLLALELLPFTITVALVALYGLTVSGHFPAEFRGEKMQTGIGTATIWTTLITASLAALVALGIAISVLPWPAIIISGGAMLLAAPLLLRSFSDWFVDGEAALISFALGAIVSASVMWIAK
jgi:hypothetical protein